MAKLALVVLAVRFVASATAEAMGEVASFKNGLEDLKKAITTRPMNFTTLEVAIKEIGDAIKGIPAAKEGCDPLKNDLMALLKALHQLHGPKDIIDHIMDNLVEDGDKIFDELSEADKSWKGGWDYMSAGQNLGMAFRRSLVGEMNATADYTCPGSGSPVHASCKVTAVAAAACADVLAEMKLRAGGQSGWVDPHNSGIYNVTSSSETELQTQRTTNPKTSVGHKVYTDKQIFTLISKGADACQIDACSESQGTSVGDFSTNYCDMRNLYCGSADGCKPVSKDFTSTQSSVHPSIGAGTDFSKCIVKPNPVHV